MSVVAVEKARGTEKKIVIQNESDRLTEEQIEKMVRDAETNKVQDELVKKTVQERNQLEQLCYNIKAQLNDDKLKDKFTDEEKEKVHDISDSTLRYLEGEPNACLEALQLRTKKVNEVFHPIMTRIY